jgi:hypothetical protein
MTQQRDIERLLDQWFSDGPTQAPDRVLVAVTDRIERQSQRPAWRLNRRPIAMNISARIAAAAAAVVAIAIIGYTLLPSSSGVGGPSETITPTASPTPSVPPTALDVGQYPVGGRYRLQPFDAAASLAIDVDVPAGWWGFPKWALLGPNGTGAPYGIGIGFLSPTGLFSDPCRWDVEGSGRLPQQGDVVVGPTVDDLAAALQAIVHYEASEPVDVTIGGRPAKRLDLQLPTDVDFTSCDVAAGQSEGSFFPWATAEADGSNLYAQGPGNRWQVSIMEVSGTRFVVVVDDYEATPEAERAAAQAIVDSITIRP